MQFNPQIEKNHKAVITHKHKIMKQLCVSVCVCVFSYGEGKTREHKGINKWF